MMGLKKKIKDYLQSWERKITVGVETGSGDRISASTKPVMHLQGGEKPLGFTSLQKLSFFPDWEKNYL